MTSQNSLARLLRLRMITRIELHNFMSHRHTVIEPAAGLTVLVGPNNVGKSAIVAALQILCHNDDSGFVIRHGERECKVMVETDDGHSIEWRRKNAPSYLIDGTRFDRLGRGGQPDELQPLLRLAKVLGTNGSEFDIHFGTQKSPIFLLDTPPSNAAQFFASSSDASRLVAMQKRHKDKHAAAKRDKTRLEAESRHLNAQLAVLEAAVPLDEMLTKTEKLHAELRLSLQLADEMGRHTQVWQTQSDTTVQLSAQTAELKPLTEPPKLEDTKPLKDCAAELVRFAGELVRAEKMARALLPLTSPPAMDDVPSLEELLMESQTLQIKTEQAGHESKALRPLAQPPQLADEASQAQHIEKLQQRVEQLAAEMREARALESITPPPMLDDEAQISRLVDELAEADRVADQLTRLTKSSRSLLAPEPVAETKPLEQLTRQVAAAMEAADQMAKALAVAEEEFAAAASNLRAAAEDGVCEQCGAPLDADRLIQRAALAQEVCSHE